MTAECPWSGFEPTAVDFCEQNVCGWIVEPSNTVSCAAFVVAGLIIMAWARRDGVQGFLRWLGPVTIGVGVFSVALHATMTFWGGRLDIFSMYLLATSLIFLNLGRLGLKAGLLPYGAVNGVLGVVLVLVRSAVGIPLFGILMTIVGLQEIHLFVTRSRRARVDYRWFWITSAIFFSGLGVWMLDLSRVLCDPANHWLQGHSYWHVSCAGAAVGAYRFFLQFGERQLESG